MNPVKRRIKTRLHTSFLLPLKSAHLHCSLKTNCMQYFHQKCYRKIFCHHIFHLYCSHCKVCIIFCDNKRIYSRKPVGISVCVVPSVCIAYLLTCKIYFDKPCFNVFIDQKIILFFLNITLSSFFVPPFHPFALKTREYTNR